MSQNLKSVYRIFYITGISFDPPSTRKNLRQNLWSLWSILMITFHFVAAIVSVVQIKLITNAIQPFFTIFIFLCFGTQSILFCAVRCLKYEKKFWKLVRQSENIFLNHLSKRTNYNELKHTRRKIFVSIAFLLFGHFSVIGSAWVNGNILMAKAATAVFFPISVMRLSAMKFTFYVDVLHFRLDQIRLVWQRNRISLKNTKSLEKAYILCLTMSEQIEEIFARIMLFNLFLAFVEVLYIFKSIMIAITDEKFNISTFFIIMSIGYTLFIIFNTCQKCSDCASSIAPLILSRNCIALNSVVETLALQLLHQRIVFKTKGLFSINHKCLMSVS